MSAVAIRSVKKYYGGVAAIRGVDIAIEDGEFVVLVGPSGCGKSTLLRAVAGLEEVSGGAVEIGGKDVTRWASMAKLKAGRLAREVADTCLQFWGGMGFMHESKISRFFRDGRLCSIGGGADEIMLSIICKLDGTLPRTKKE